MDGARRMWAALQLLDHQIIDRNGRFAGNVDDIELDFDADGRLMVTALWSGPGMLAHRMGARRLGAWLRRMHVALDDKDGSIPLGQVAEIGTHVSVALDAEQLSSEATERWVRDHVISRIPGNDHEAE